MVRYHKHSNCAGINNTVVDGITSGLSALVHAYDLLRNDPLQDAVAVVAADEIGTLFHDVFERRGWLAKRSDASLLNPYGRGDGYIMGEGGGALILERASVARQRGAKPLAKIAGVGATADSFAFRDLNPAATYMTHAMRSALNEARVTSDQIDWLIGHGRGTAAYDQREIAAWMDVFGQTIPPISCLSGNVGVTPASSGLFSIAAALLGLQHGEAYPLTSVDESLDARLPFVKGGVQISQYRRVMVAGSTEHGNNHAIVLERVD